MADITFEQSPPRQTQHRRNPQRFFLVVIALLSVILVAELFYHVMVSQWLRIDRIVLESELALSERTVLQMAGVDRSTHFFSVDPATIEESFAQMPAVKSVTVSKRFPNVLTISITKRTPLAIAFADDGQTPLLFDAAGVVFEWKEQVRGVDLPVISGLRFENAGLGTTLPRYLGAFLHDLKTLKQQSPELYRQFSEYRIVPKGERDFEVLLYPQSYDVPVRIEAGLDERTAKYIIMILDAFRRDGSLDTMRELDLRAGEVVYRMKEKQ